MPQQNYLYVQIFDATPLIPYHITSRATVLVFSSATHSPRAGALQDVAIWPPPYITGARSQHTPKFSP